KEEKAVEREEPAEAFPCELCSKLFDSKQKFDRHKKGVHGPIKSCGVCNKSFTNAGNLKQHVSSVLDKVSFACDQCGKRFTQRGYMIDHKKRFHEEERPFPCLSCDKRFARKQHLDSHVGNVH